METLIATVLIMVIFMMASLILNTVFSNSIKSNTRSITAKLNEIEYLYRSDKLQLPYIDDYKDWIISAEHNKASKGIKIKASNAKTKKDIEQQVYENEASKVQGFTLQEMVITMIISTIVIGLAFSVLTMVQRHMWSIQKNFELNTEYNRLEQALWIDINTSTSISFKARKIN